MSNCVRFDTLILNGELVTDVTRNPDGTVTVGLAGRFEGLKILDLDRAAAVWAFFLEKSPGGMNSPAMTDPSTAAAVGRRDIEWQAAFNAWAYANQNGRAFPPGFSRPPQAPAEVAVALDETAYYATREAEHAAEMQVKTTRQ